MSEAEEAQELLQQARQHQRRGQLFRAHDTALRGLQIAPSDVWLQHQVVLSLARAGAAKVAQERFLGFRLNTRDEEDLAALGARIEKDLALAAFGDQRWDIAKIASASYRAIHRRTKGHYPLVNAASLCLLFADMAQMRELAEATLKAVEANPGTTNEEIYFAQASRAEAELLLGRRDAALRILQNALAAYPDDLAARASTLRNLEFVSHELRIGLDWLEPLRAAPVLQYVGHIISPPGAPGRFPAEQEAAVRAAIDREVDKLRPRHAYGSLAAGADILFAEALLAKGCALHVVLPVDREAFIEASIGSAGQRWRQRFHACMEAAASIAQASDESVLDYENLFAFGARYTAGLALMQARTLRTGVHQLAVWDGLPGAGAVGTAAEVGAWKQRGLPQTVIPCSGGSPVATPLETPGERPYPRVVGAMLSGDFVGFARLNDDQLSTFVAHVLVKLRSALSKHQDRLRQASFAGGTFFLMFQSVEDAAACALDLQDAMASVALGIAGLPTTLQMRIGGHYGPMLIAEAGMFGQPVALGTEVTRAAHVEPIAPGACVYVTAPFAAQLALSDKPQAMTQYVGVGDAGGNARPIDIFLLTRITGAMKAVQEQRVW